ncbi:MAG: accessory gene regulator B family protein [Oscillospiraceae bacterium]|jgi:accessory gene regulator B|nr:accessory gene regulator B family protein [Oscillospiraceae bacterium]MCR5305260.1 accessory gene regulator B family protein [Oscillospiraceae bacterium]
MFSRLTDRITDSFVQTHTIPQADREIYRCGVQQLLQYITSFAATLIIGILCGMLWQCAVFAAAYMLLRHCCGGFHAKTPFRCYLFSAVLIAAAMQLIRLLSGTRLGCGTAVVISAVCILLFAPVGSQNKPLDGTERTVFHRRACLVMAAESAAAFGLMLAGMDRLSACFAAALAVMCSMLLLGMAKNKCTNYHDITSAPRSEASEEDAE